MSFALITIPFIIIAILFVLYLIITGKFFSFLKWIFIAAFTIVAWPIGLMLAVLNIRK
ncbi:MAG TPA: hypothetical protein O0X50_02295 [Methanocorpusculum sp.]|nr:hypothetical protein [Methanocorpusculum sp.]